jgi:uncharacterized protein YjbI with pentapeptide repeats
MPDPAAPVLPPGLEPARPGTLAPGEEWSGLNVVGADLTGQDGEELVVERSVLVDCRLTAVHLRELRATDVRLADTDLSGADLSSSSLVRVEFVNCRLGDVVLSDTRLRDVTLADCKLAGANLRFSKAERIVFRSCSLVDADLSGCAFSDAAFEDCDLRQANFHQAGLAGARLIGCKLDEVKGPSGLRGTTIDGTAVLPLALSLFGELRIAIEGGEG